MKIFNWPNEDIKSQCSLNFNFHTYRTKQYQLYISLWPLTSLTSGKRTRHKNECRKQYTTLAFMILNFEYWKLLHCFISPPPLLANFCHVTSRSLVSPRTGFRVGNPPKSPDCCLLFCQNGEFCRCHVRVIRRSLESLTVNVWHWSVFIMDQYDEDRLDFLRRKTRGLFSILIFWFPVN